ncbi:MAG TPA: c-type cytochrome [Gaiellaceae bacterium]|nr:c-type cytochrome [Gaiellaceae bacterium]
MLALVVASLSTGHKIGLATVGAAFIVFALVSSFVLPRRIPNFPGRFMGLYLTISVLFFVAMLSAVLIFGKEKAEGAGEGHETTTAQTTPAAPSATGDATAGKAVFASAGCASCHTLKDAGSHGTIGPDLDQLKPAEAIVQHQVENGGGPMPAFKGQLTAKQIQDVAAYVFTATHSS